MVAYLDLPELRAEVDGARRRLELERGSSDDEAGRAQTELRLIDADIERIQADIERLEGLGKLVAKNRLRPLRASILDLERRKVAVKSQQARRGRVSGVRAELEKLERQLAEVSVVRSRSEGQVLALRVAEGSYIERGKSLIDLQDQEAEIEVVIFVPSAEAKKVCPGQEVRISPKQFKREEWGYICGRVTSVSVRPETYPELTTIFKNATSVNALVQEVDLPYKVVVKPSLDPANVSGFEWSTGSGPEVEVGSNADCDAQVVINTKQPWQYVIPPNRGTPDPDAAPKNACDRWAEADRLARAGLGEG